MNENNLLSVIIPAYNHERFICDAIDSVLNQTYTDLELIVIDDGSTDGTPLKVQGYHDHRLRFIKQHNMGAHVTINRGLELSRGEFIAILNSDDIYEIDRFEKMIALMKRDPEIGFACSYLSVIDQNGKQLGIKRGWENMLPWEISHYNPPSSLNEFQTNIVLSNFISTTSNFLFRRNLLTRTGGMRSLRYAHDWDFALRAAQCTKCEMVKEPLLRYRTHPNNTIKSDRRWMILEILCVYALHISGILSAVNQNELEQQLSLMNGINLQGNDHLFWMMKELFNGLSDIDKNNLVQSMYQDESIRELFYKYIVEGER